MKIYILVSYTYILFLLYISFKSLIEEKYSSCIYDPKTNISYIHVDTKIAWVVLGAKYAVHIKYQMLIYFI